MAERIEGLSIGLSLDTIKIDTGLQSLKSKLTMVNSEMKNNMSAFDRGEKSVAKYQTQLDGLNKKIEVQKAVTAAAQKNYEKMVKEHGEGSKEAEKAATQYNNQAASLNNLERYVDGVTKEMKEFIEQQRIAESSWGKFGTKMDEMGSKLTAMGDKMKKAGKNMSMYVTAPIVGIGAAAIKVGADFQEGMSQVSAISGATSTEIASLEKQARDLGAATQFSAKEAADGMQFLAMAGFKTNDILKAMPGMLDLAAAGALELGSAADIASNILSAFSIDAAESGHVADVLAAAAANANTDVSQLGEAMKYLAPAANSLGWSLEDSTAAVMALGDAGIQGSLAGQAFGSSLTRLANPTKKMGKVLKATGAEFFNAEGVMKTMPEIIKELEVGMEGMTQEQKAANLTTLFGANAYKHWAVLLEKGSAELQVNKEMLEGADGAAAQMAKTMNDNAKGDIKIFQSAMQELSIQIYEILEPSIRKIIQSLTGLVEKFQQMPKGTKVAIVAISGIAAAIGPVLVVLGTLTAALGGIMTAIAPVATAIAGAGGLAAAFGTAGASVLAFATGPVGIAIAAIAGIGIGAVALGNKLKKDAIPEVDRFGKGVSAATKEALGGFFDLSDGASEQLSKMTINGKAVTQEMADSISGKFKKMNAQILDNMQKQHGEQIKEMESFFLNSSALSNEREQEILNKQKLRNQQREVEQKYAEGRIQEILQNAVNQKREITQSEKDQINAIQLKMNETAVQYLTDNQRDQKVILENMKNQAADLSARQAVEVVMNSATARDKVIKDAEKKYNDTLAFAIKERDENGSISEEEASKIIQEAKKKRDSSVKYAQDSHKEVVKEAKSQAQDHVNEVDWETGKILSKWDVFKNNIKKKTQDAGQGVTDVFGTMWKNVQDKISAGIGTITSLWSGLKTNFSSKISDMKSTFDTLGEFLKPSLEALKNFFLDISVKIANFANNEGAQLVEAFKNIGSVIGVVVKAIWTVVKFAFDQILTVIKFVMPAVLFIVETIWGNIKGVIKGALDVIMGAVKVFSGLFTGDFKKMWEGVKQIFSGAITFVWNFIQLQFFGKILSGAKLFIAPFKSGFSAMWKAVTEIFTKAGTGISSFLKNTWDLISRTTTTTFNGISKFLNTIWTTILNFIKTTINAIFNGIKTVWTSISSTTSNIFTNIFNTIKNIFTNIFNSISTAVSNILSKITTSWNTVKTTTTKAFTDVFNTIKNRFTDIVEAAKALPKRIGDGIGSMASKVTTGVTKVVNTLASTLGKGINGVIGGVNWVLGKIGVKTLVPLWDIPRYAAGTKGHPGGLAVVGDGRGRNAGPELIQTPDGKTALSPAKDTLVNLPKGTQVMSALDTRNILGNVPKYAKGIGDIASHAWDKTKDVGKKIADVALDVFDYIKNPGKLLDLAMNAVGAIVPSAGNFVGDMAKGAFGMVKKGAVEFLKGKLAEFGESKGSGFGPPFRLNSRYGWRIHPITGVKTFHRGDDWGAPSGTPIPNQVAGTVVNSGYMEGRGNYVRIKSGIMERIYQHNSRNSVRVGQSVGKGQTVGLVGSTGWSTGPHLHYEVFKNGVNIDPQGFASGGYIGKSGMYNLAEEGHGEFVIPTDPKRRPDAMKLLALAAKSITGGGGNNVRPSGMSGNGGVFESLLAATLEQNRILMQLLQKNPDVYLDGQLVGQGVYDTVDGMSYDKASASAYMKGVRV
ncbi:MULTISPECIES: phage tail tape measure protein [unclassified Sporosarcina]|uniref:phage tail tape measure protein n=1 Tax=unclassified Sporosarcina TaxID=2647733 RepID=UPI00203ABE5A|nr:MULTISPECIES: phage tail tape measure protein [unclassified Sporosarcina]GKV67298.1 hypothetical protein NCCP2331_34510 [Sporosarcina sp. NCCP-2331]GLB57641.1 hypothetical protein NCCP2378_34310 [Sporosarcina sp. NCCP-2378]